MYSATLKAGFKSIIWEEMSFKWTTFEETNGDQSSNLENIQFQTKIIHAVQTWHKHKYVQVYRHNSFLKKSKRENFFLVGASHNFRENASRCKLVLQLLSNAQNCISLL